MRYVTIFLLSTASFLTAVVLSGCAAKRPGTESADTQTPEIRYDYLYVIKPTVNIRKNSSENSALIGSLNDGDSVVVLLNRDGWYQVRSGSNIDGWIRSDLLGPAGLSVYPRAVEYADSLKIQRGVDLFFDTRLHHRRIFLSFPPAEYSDRSRIITLVERIVSAYQSEVYPGALSVIVLNPDSDEVFYEAERVGTKNADVLLPIVPFGIIIAAELEQNRAHVSYIVSGEIEEQRYIAAAREMAGTYPLSYREILFIFFDENNNCRFWFREDSDGELYRFGSCP